MTVNADPEIKQHGVERLASELKQALIDYLASQHHIRHEDVVLERQRLLEDGHTIAQEPFIETIPGYALANPYNELGLPEPLGNVLAQMTTWSEGARIFPRPFRHQADALRAFFTEHEDLVVSTGTGSGKTETFLWSMLGSMLLEGARARSTFAQPGMRALILYPTNALVGDQLSRLRRLFASGEMKDLFTTRNRRVPQFGMYTSRTPYPGPRSTSRDQMELGKAIRFYDDIDHTDPALKAKLIELGRWPAKDLRQFAAAGFRGAPDDSELYTRQEMQEWCPDLLVTNYSMLEYMLMRPVERSIFRQTREWLEQDRANELIIVLDEAHLYRGSAGTEVALLVRRLIARLGVDQSRVRFVLTSASLGTDEEAREFAQALTGKPGACFAVITSQRERLEASAQASSEDAHALANLDPGVLFDLADTNEQSRKLSVLAGSLGWSHLSGSHADWRESLFQDLAHYPPLQLILERTAFHALAREQLAAEVFPGVSAVIKDHALTALLLLGNLARSQGKPLLAARAHLLFRGLPAVYACVNPVCDARRHRPGEQGTLGRLYAEPRVHCDCSGRVYELLSHSDCGALFLRVFHRPGSDPDFFWHERGGEWQENHQPALQESLLLVSEPHPDAIKDVQPVRIQVSTGRRAKEAADDIVTFYLVRHSKNEKATRSFQAYFQKCPVCRKQNARTRIRAMRSVGEEPFASLVKRQFFLQPPVGQRTIKNPNGGRKALLFSDGRQRAARLARDLPRAVELESFREALLESWEKLVRLKGPRASLKSDDIYRAFINTCAEHSLPFFDDEDNSQTLLLDHMRQFEAEFGSDLEFALEDFTPSISPGFRRALLRQLADPHASLSRTGIGWPIISSSAITRIKRTVEQQGILRLPITMGHLETYASAWVALLLDAGLVDQTIGDPERQLALPQWESIRPESAVNVLSTVFGSEHRRLHDFLMNSSLMDGDYVSPGSLALDIEQRSVWRICPQCSYVQASRFSEFCLQCGQKRPEPIASDSDRFAARFGYWRRPAFGALRDRLISHMSVEEHSAQLSWRDIGRAYATTGEHELRFLDVHVAQKPPIDVLSCTTTMEVGIDIGALTAVGLRNIPPRRDNYQQRAGRAGRRGTSISSVVTYGLDGPHDSHYFSHPEELVSGKLQRPRIHEENSYLAKRHLYAWLIQTYFHETLDEMSEQRVARNIFDSLGTTRGFFGGHSHFNYASFQRWTSKVMQTRRQLLKWLPQTFQRELDAAVQELLDRLGQISGRFMVDHVTDEGFLDVLFGEGLLPSYAFPTDVVSFSVFDGSGKIAEQPQLAKIQALSEYAPGRTVVVNKKTYRVGGLYHPYLRNGGVKDTLDSHLYVYEYCASCTYVRTTREGDERDRCPVCASSLHHMKMIDPPGFAPENAAPLRDRDQLVLYTSARRAQLPMPESRDEGWAWAGDLGRKLVYAYARNQHLLVANIGADGAGFSICHKCGAARPSDGPEVMTHKAPFPSRRGYAEQCSGTFIPGYALGTSIQTDVLLTRLRFEPPFTQKVEPPLIDALWSASEALALAASLHLDVDPSELSAGFRFINQAPTLAADIYLYDTASGGAGYAYEAGKSLKIIMKRAITMLEACPGACDRSCTRCLRNYSNQFDHHHLDRFLGLGLLRYMMTEEVPSIDRDREIMLTKPLRDYLQLEEGLSPKNGTATLRLATPGSPRDRNVRICSCLSEPPKSSGDCVWIDDYTVTRDLPRAAEMLR